MTEPIPPDVLETATAVRYQFWQAKYGAYELICIAKALMDERQRFTKEDEARLAYALHEIDHLRGPKRESVQVFREFYRAMCAAAIRQEQPKA
jgi:hypothetical protein